MTQVAPGRPERVSRARRWCSRALLVIGGSVIATAAAWSVSTASAIADQDNSGSRNDNHTASQHRSANADDALSRARDFASDPAQFLHAGAESAAEAIRTGGEPHQADDAASQNGSSPDKDGTSSPGTVGALAETVGTVEDDGAEARDLAQNSVMESCGGSSALIKRLLGADQESPFEDSGWEDRFQEWFEPGFDDIISVPENSLDVPGLPNKLPAPADRPASAPNAAAGHSGALPVALDSTQDDDTSRGMSDNDSREFIPELPSNGIPLQMPGAPAAPSVPNSGHAGHGNADGSTVGATFGLGNALDALMADTALVGTSRVPVEPGRQPGVTPD